MEFAIAAPIMLTSVFGTFEMCRMSLIYNMAQDAAYDACRHAMVEGATATEARDKALEVLSLVGAQDVSVVINDGQAFTDKTKQVKVVVTIPMEANALLLRTLFTGREIQSTITMNMERYSGFYDATQ